MKKLLFPLLTLMLLIVAACQQAPHLDEPPKLVLGQDVCEECGYDH